MIHFGPDIEAILRRLPMTGPLFPYLQIVRCGDRATEFKPRCAGLGITGASLHSYRYAWAERASNTPTRNGSRRRRSATTARRCIEPTLRLAGGRCWSLSG